MSFMHRSYSKKKESYAREKKNVWAPLLIETFLYLLFFATETGT